MQRDFEKKRKEKKKKKKKKNETEQENIYDKNYNTLRQNKNLGESVSFFFISDFSFVWPYS
jgi:hypothetical protein